ncbi:SAM-dependent methyltransferase [Actinokineospora terrae]|uniref:Methyltransferase domain-containing protein n=1 Tax=Actinokineospora terrae TaxID=155974 RepID=A0A1H9MH49_9PSEU|nr:class I SAM-dependent methyltransferase [Actinokineospora terrae]SER23024.1 Methyltransferase domain-containing protein [Actinokineospora terrae]
MDIPRIHTIRESSHRIHNPIDATKLATLGRALGIGPGATALDLACGTGEMLCTWARDHGVIGTGVDLSSVFIERARARATELGVAVTFQHGDASQYVARERVDLVSCLGATWIGGGLEGTIALLDRSLKPGGLMVIGEPYWLSDPPDEAVAACHLTRKDEFGSLPDLVDRYDELGYDLVEMVLADKDSWDRYAAAQWLNLRRWADANPEDDLVPQVRAESRTAPRDHVRYQREYLGWGAFALMRR